MVMVAREPTVEPFRFEDSRQERIYRRLLLVGPGPAACYRDACRLMAAKPSFETTTYLVVLLLRAIESALHGVLESPIAHDERLTQQHGTHDDAHRDEILAILRGLEILETHPVAQAWLKLAGEEEHYDLYARAHLDVPAPPHPADEAFHKFWDEMEAIVDTVLEQFESRCWGSCRLLDEVLAKPFPSVEDAEWAKQEARWVERQQRLYAVLPEKLGAFITHLARGGQAEAALLLARPLLAVLAEPMVAEGTGKDTDSHALPKLRVRFDLQCYEQILRKNIPDLTAAAGADAIQLLCDLLEAAIRLSRHPEDDDGAEDYSYIWRPAVEDHGQNRSPGVRDLLVSAVRDAAEQIAKPDPARVPGMVKRLEGRPWRIFHRLALHLLRLFPHEASALIAERLTDRVRFDATGLRHEYALLARDRFGYLSPDEQATILSWIDGRPNLGQSTSGQATDAQAERYDRIWKLNRLAPIRDSLPPEWSDRYAKWVAELGEPEHPEFVSYRSYRL